VRSAALLLGRRRGCSCAAVLMPWTLRGDPRAVHDGDRASSRCWHLRWPSPSVHRAVADAPARGRAVRASSSAASGGWPGALLLGGVQSRYGTAGRCQPARPGRARRAAAAPRRRRSCSATWTA
jgi:hypothetical protein